jgi:5-methylcytosine-specific restriction endonuclease McrA
MHAIPVRIRASQPIYAGQDCWCNRLSYKEEKLSSILRPGTTFFRGQDVMDTLHTAVLVLNASYEPINICSAKRAMTLVCKGAAIVQEVSPHWIRTGKAKFPLPSVIRLVSYRAVPRITRSVSRRSIMVRDSHTCQYCQSALPAAKLTLDHVIPRSRGGRSTWENLVACCYPCNNRKGDRLPEEASMTLLRQPRSFGLHARHQLLGAGNRQWTQYLFC